MTFPSTVVLGDTELSLIRDGGLLRPDGEAVFGVPPSRGWASYIPPEDDGSIAVMPHSLLVRRQGRTALVDTGGENVHEVVARRSTFMQSLADSSVSPADVDTVLITHAHLDHVGYNTLPVDGDWLPAFPNARFFLQRSESDSLKSSAPDRWNRYFGAIAAAGNLVLLDGDAAVGDRFRCMPTPGHTPGHQSVFIDCGGPSAVYLGDLAITRLHLEHVDWNPSWIWSAEEDRRSKLRLIDAALRKDALLVVGHDPVMPWARLQRSGASVRTVDFAP
ncbi:MAG: MBL fold metallo-hydrolase [Planctomycetes bacterium]|nr:MBL fold metallo-hydrolase [Planctomycetota bacterium]